MPALLLLGFGILFAIQFHAQIVLADVTATLDQVSTWPAGEQNVSWKHGRELQQWPAGSFYRINFKNNDPSRKTCAITFTLIPAKGMEFEEVTFVNGLKAIPGTPNKFRVIDGGMFTVPDNTKLAPGEEKASATIQTKGTQQAPTFGPIEPEYYTDTGFCLDKFSEDDGGDSEDYGDDYKDDAEEGR